MATTTPLKQGGMESAAPQGSNCRYDGSDGTFGAVLAGLTRDGGSVDQNNSDCVTVVGGQVIAGVGRWACFVPGTSRGILEAGNGKYVLGVNGNATLDILKQVVTAALAKLPM